LVLLAGGAGLRSLSGAIGRSVLDLPVNAQETVLSKWRRQVDRVDDATLSAGFRIQIVGGAPLHSLANEPLASYRIEHLQDPSELRGSGGALRDVAAAYDDDAYVIVASAASVLLQPLTELLDELLAAESDVAFFVYPDATASGLMLVRCGCLRSLASVGFVDLKEQALPVIAGAHRVTAIRRAIPVGASARTVANYIHVLKALNGPQCETRNRAAGGEEPTAFDEAWQPSFSLIEDGARVAGGARLHDSVVLSGGEVGRNAVVVRSVVCPGASVPANATIVDRLITSSRSRTSGTHVQGGK
jgi:hypothetical protein